MNVEITVVTPITFGPKGKKLTLKPGNHEIEDLYLQSPDARDYMVSGDLLLRKATEPAFPFDESKIIDVEIPLVKEPEPEEPQPKFRKIRTKKEK